MDWSVKTRINRPEHCDRKKALTRYSRPLAQLEAKDCDAKPLKPQNSRIHTADEGDGRLTEIFRRTSRAPFALTKRVSALFVLQELLHLECQTAGVGGVC